MENLVKEGGEMEIVRFEIYTVNHTGNPVVTDEILKEQTKKIAEVLATLGYDAIEIEAAAILVDAQAVEETMALLEAKRKEIIN